MRYALSIVAALGLAMLSPAAAQTTQNSEAPGPRKEDLLGLGALSKDRPKGSQTEITAQKEATFNEKENMAIFVGDVRVKDPAFLLSCDTLKVYLNKGRSGIERALADGNVVIVQQTANPSEKGAVGRSKQAEYIPSTGAITLIGWPEIQQGINRHLASQESTRMVLNRDGRATTDGPSRTVITDTEEAGKIR
ncbi:MAG: LptA/OstA family protein [Chthoniobacterales bacterium]